MRSVSPSLVLMLLAMFSTVGRAGVRPSFGIDSEAWRSTDIVLVSALPTDGTFEVIEVWKGGLRARARIVVPQLIPKADALPISQYRLSDAFDGSIAEQIPRQGAGSHLVLFLIKNSSSSEKTEWEPANFMDSMRASAVWIEGNELYSFIQEVNPGPSVLRPMRSCSLKKLKERVAEVTRIQEEMQSIVSGPGQQKAQLIKPYVRSDITVVRLFAEQELGRAGPAAVPTIREMLDDSAYAEQSPELIEAMVKSGGRLAGADLTHRLQQEVAFWESTGPSLPVGWWNQQTTSDAPLRLRYDRTYQLIIGLEKIGDRSALAAVEQLRTLWISYPQLNDPSGLDQMSLECEKLIAVLQSN